MNAFIKQAVEDFQSAENEVIDNVKKIQEVAVYENGWAIPTIYVNRLFASMEKVKESKKKLIECIIKFG